MINFGKVIFDEYGIKIVIESEMLNNIQKSIKKQYHSYNWTNDIDVTKEWYLCRFSNQISKEAKNKLYISLIQLMNDSKNKKQAFQEVSKIKMSLIIKHLAISTL